MKTEKPVRGRPKKHLLALSEVAEYLQVSRGTMYKLLAEGLPYYRLGSSDLRFDLERVLEWAEAETERRKAEGIDAWGGSREAAS